MNPLLQTVSLLIIAWLPHHALSSPFILNSIQLVVQKAPIMFDGCDLTSSQCREAYLRNDTVFNRGDCFLFHNDVDNTFEPQDCGSICRPELKRTFNKRKCYYSQHCPGKINSVSV